MDGTRQPGWIGLLVAATACGPGVAPSDPAPVSMAPAIDTMTLRADTWFLAHDRLRGRATGSAGAAIARQFIAARCRALGFTVSELPVPLEEAIVIAQQTVLEVGERRFHFGDDFVLAAGTQEAVRGFTGVPVWVGTSDDIVRTAGDRPLLAGRVALSAGPVRPAAAARLAALGAEAVVHLVPDPETWSRYAARRGPSLLYVADAAVRSSFHPPFPAVLAHPALAGVLLDAAGAERSVTLTLAVERVAVRDANLACSFVGTDSLRRERWIGLTAHYDHLGVAVPGRHEAEDSVYNGFSDNAAGVAMLLAIAEALRRSPRGGPAHSVVLLFFTGEERGLLGSDHYVAHPLIPLDRMAAVVNLDAGAPPAPPRSWEVAGGAGSPLGELAAEVAARRGWGVRLSEARPNSDYFPFARAGVPAVFPIPGPGAYEGLSTDSSRALRRRWDRYHLPGDEWHPDFPFAGLRRYAEYALLIVQAVDRE